MLVLVRTADGGEVIDSLLAGTQQGTVLVEMHSV